MTLSELITYVRDSLGNEFSHNFGHSVRVYRNCLLIASEFSNVDYDVLKVSSLLHDIAKIDEYSDTTDTVDHALRGAEKSRYVLKELNYDERFIRCVEDCVSTHRFRSKNVPKSVEAVILYDADKLDLLGTVGIARMFILAGQYGLPMYSFDSLDTHIKNNMGENYRIKDISKHSPNIEFDFKIKNIRSKLITETAIKLSEERVLYMSEFFGRLRKECDCHNVFFTESEK